MTQLRHSFLFILLFFLNCISNYSYSQSTGNHSSGKILQDIKKLNVLQSALYIAAHPDDENNRLIAYLANEELAEVSYLSLTRGDGGQNLIGSEQREELGILRTQELLEARKIDGGRQLFATANDFGFSKSPEETLTIWDKNKILSDVVWIIRKTRPDILITRYSHLQSETHGHHIASSRIAYEAFNAAADPSRFPEQLKYVQPWQPKRLLWNIEEGAVSPELNNDNKKQLSLNIGKYNALLGKSYGEIAAESRTRHKCQGMGTTPQRGDSIEHFKLTKGDETSTNIFENVDHTWQRIQGGKAIANFISKAIKNYNPQKPSASIPNLLSALSKIEKLPDSYWKEVKLNAIKDVIQEVLGLVLEPSISDFSINPGQKININIEAINRSDIKIQLKHITFSSSDLDTALNLDLANNKINQLQLKIKLNNDVINSQPYWLRKKSNAGNFEVNDPQDVGNPENGSLLNANFNLQINGQSVNYTLPLKYKYTDPVAGEVYQPVAVTPPVFVNLAKKVYVFPDNQPQKVEVRIKSGKDHIQGTTRLKLPEGWKISPAASDFYLKNKNDETTAEFTITPPPNAQETEMHAVIEMEEKHYSQGLKIIKYDHIPAQVYFPQAAAKLVKLDLKKTGNKIAYIPGAADLVAEHLQQAGYDVSILKDTQISFSNLLKFDAVILGIRAYNVNQRLNFYKNELLKYVENGGNLIVQYNTNFDLPANDIGPFPLSISAQRITDENAVPTFLNPLHPVLNFPNKITLKDFEGWVQERGAYFPVTWSKAYQSIFSFKEFNETALNGGLLIAPFGKGFYVYTTLSWFRQLPAGVPGAYRLFANIIGLSNTMSRSE